MRAGEAPVAATRSRKAFPGHLDHGTRASYVRNNAGGATAGDEDAFFDEKVMDIDQGMWGASSSR